MIISQQFLKITSTGDFSGKSDLLGLQPNYGCKGFFYVHCVAVSISIFLIELQA